MPQWTQDQRHAIEARGGTLLLSAAAGSGKTAVLVERAVHRITDPTNPVDVDRLLVVTFSNAAAGEMRARIQDRLAALVRERPGDGRLRRQQMLLARTQISTIHAFCANLIRQHFERLSIAADFRIADEGQMTALRARAVEAVLERWYQAGDPVFYELCELIAPGRDDRRMGEVVLRLYDFMRAQPFPRRWLDRTLALYDDSIPPEETVWGRLTLTAAREAIGHALETLRGAQLQIEGVEAMRKAYGPAFQSDIDGAAAFQRVLETGGWDEIRAALEGITFQKLGSLRGFADSTLQNFVKGVREDYKKTVARLREGPFCAGAADFAGDLRDLRPKLEVLFELTRQFDDAITRLKADEPEGDEPPILRLLDFNDLEQKAIELLAEPEGEGYRPTDAARALWERYDEILIDEYQDVSGAQDLLFRALSNREENLFMVGDVKQSIYRFRQAVAELFIGKKTAFSPYDGVHYPAKIILGQNFRSRAGITGGVNFLFEQLMSGAVGGVDYGEEDRLYAGADARYPDTGPAVALRLIEGADARSGAELEATRIGGEILRMLEAGFPVAEGEGCRPLRPGDCAILLRSTQQKAEIYRRTLERMGLPAHVEGKNDAAMSREIGWLLALLRVLRNPSQDLPMTALLISPLFGFTADELAMLRIDNRTGSLYSGLAVRAAGGDSHCRETLETLGDCRRMAAALPLGDFLDWLLDRVDLRAIGVAADRTGRAEGNLQRFLDYAARYERAGEGSLAGFVRQLDRLLEEGGTLPGAAAAGGGDAVRILSIHRSKGLEFPVCFVADLAKPFNRQDSRGSVLLHAEAGFCCVRREASGKQYTTVPLEAARLAIQSSMLSEEMRVLYVALTRAKQRLVLVGRLEKLDRRLASLAGMLTAHRRIPPAAVRGCGSYLDWILLGLLRHPDAEALRARCPARPHPFEADFPLEIDLADAAAIPEAEAAAANHPESADPAPIPPDRALLDALRRRFAFRYPHSRAAEIPVKLAVSAIAHAEHPEGMPALARPRFLESEGLSPAERGTALHRFMQYADFARAAEDADGEIARLIARGNLSPAEGASIDRGRLHRFFQSALYRRMATSPRLMRELRFIDELPARLLDPTLEGDDGEERIIIQGVADCVFEEGDGFVIVDYKTDRVRDPMILRERYHTQLRLYAHALTRALGRPIRHCILYALYPALEIELPVEE